VQGFAKLKPCGDGLNPAHKNAFPLTGGRRPVAGLSENHQRRILTTFRHIDDLLGQSLNALAPAKTNLGSRCVQDLSLSRRHRIEKSIELIREMMRHFLERSQISLPERSTTSSWTIRTNLTSLDIALEDLHPKKMKGYGEMDPASAKDLSRTLQEIRGVVSQLLQSLDPSVGS
jgi:hypothetical protein